MSEEIPGSNSSRLLVGALRNQLFASSNLFASSIHFASSTLCLFEMRFYYMTAWLSGWYTRLEFKQVAGWSPEKPTFCKFQLFCKSCWYGRSYNRKKEIDLHFLTLECSAMWQHLRLWKKQLNRPLLFRRRRPRPSPLNMNKMLACITYVLRMCHVRPPPCPQLQQKNNTRDSNVVPHRSTNRARTCLTSLSRREAVLSFWYGRS